MKIEIPDEQIASFFSLISLGVLVAIHGEQATPSAGTWTLGLPKVWEPLTNNPSIPQSLIDVLQTGDELAALKSLAPESFDTEIQKLIGMLQEILVSQPDPSWVDWKITYAESEAE
jgi:hypothetical protein